MKAIQDLGGEHGAIKIMLRVLEEVATKLEVQEAVPTEDLRRMVDFIKTFADKCHHGKEEMLYFPAMREKAGQEEKELMDRLLEEHKAGREYVKKISELVDRYEANEAESALEMARNISGYVSLLDRHIDLENQKLFPTTDKYLSQEKQAELEAGFEKVESDVIGAGKHEELHQLLDQFKNVYLAKV